MTAQPDPDDVGEYLISSRSFEEYRAMFALTDADLAGDLLDCPAGGSEFTARANDVGARAVAVDPVYATPVAELRQRMRTEPGRGSAHTAAGLDRYVWDFYGDIEGHRRVRTRSAEHFAADLTGHPGRYLAGALPVLPFADRAFDLVLSSHFLFTYADRLDPDFHLRALGELCRVSRGEVRVFPLLHQAGHRLDTMLVRLLARLSAAAIAAEIRQVRYEFQRGGDLMLVLRPTG